MDESNNNIDNYEIEQVLSQRLYNVREDFRWLENKDFNKKLEWECYFNHKYIVFL